MTQPTALPPAQGLMYLLTHFMGMLLCRLNMRIKCPAVAMYYFVLNPECERKWGFAIKWIWKALPCRATTLNIRKTIPGWLLFLSVIIAHHRHLQVGGGSMQLNMTPYLVPGSTLMNWVSHRGRVSAQFLCWLPHAQVWGFISSLQSPHSPQCFSEFFVKNFKDKKVERIFWWKVHS
jgi:hypothetical protein